MATKHGVSEFAAGTGLHSIIYWSLNIGDSPNPPHSLNDVPLTAPIHIPPDSVKFSLTK
jgi:hypothetical protein